MKVFFAADHAGFELKNALVAFVRDELNLAVEDLGAKEFNIDDDYPMIIARASQVVSAMPETNRAIVIGASGQGEAMVANRFPHVRAAVYYGSVGKQQTDAAGKTLDLVTSMREHNDANVLSLGARFMSESDAKSAVTLWLSTPFSGEKRHARRVAQIDHVENSHLPLIAEVITAVMPKSREELFALAQIVRPFAKTVQLDIVDGVFDVHVTWPYTAPGVAEDFSGLTLPHSEMIFWEADLMVKEPKELGLKLIQAGVRRVIAHIEAFTDVDEARDAFEAWRSAGAQAGVSLLLDTPISAIEELFYDVDVIQIMGIAKIGAQGYPFDTRAVVRVRELRNNFSQAVINVDGGVNVTHARELIVAGANRVVVGSAIIKASDPKAAYDEIVAAIAHP